MLDWFKENDVIITIFIGAIGLLFTIKQVIISIQKHRIDKEEFISKKSNLYPWRIVTECHIVPQKI